MNEIKSKVKYFMFYLSMLLFTLAICFLLLEFVVARFYYSNLTEVSNSVFDQTLGWRLKPGIYWIKPSHTFKKHSLYINDLGIRNSDISAVREKNVKRILILGDSFTYSRTIRKEKIFSSRLQEIIDESSTKKYQVVNCGVPGYGTAQEVLLMKDLSKRGVTGDVYLLMIFTNDILDNLRLDYGSLETTLAQPGFVIHAEGNLEMRYIPQKIISKDAENFVQVKQTTKGIKIGKILKIRIRSYLQTRPDLIRMFNKLGVNVKFPRMPGLLNGWYREDILRSGVPLMKALVKEIKLEAREVGAKLLVGIIPSPIQVYPQAYGQILKRTFPNDPQVQTFFQDVTRPQDILIQICRDLELPFLDLYQILRENNEKELFIPKDGHFNEDGHAIAAESLAKFVLQNIGE